MMQPGWKDWVRSQILRATGSLVRYAQVSNNTASGDGDAVQGHQVDDDEQAGGYDYPVRRLFPFGLRSRPPAGVDACVVHAFGGSTNGIMLAAESPAYGPGDLEDGEVAIYAKAADAVIKIDKDGKITIDSPNGQNVEVTAGANVTVTANAGTGTVGVAAASIECGPALPSPFVEALLKGSVDSMGVAVTQLVGASGALKSR